MTIIFCFPIWPVILTELECAFGAYESVLLSHWVGGKIELEEQSRNCDQNLQPPFWVSLPIHQQKSKRVTAKLTSCLPLRYLWVNGYKGNGISGRDHYMFGPSGMLGTASTA